MLREGFRKQLQQEMQKWRAENVISPEQYQVLADRYQLALLGTAPQLFTIVLYGVGAILLGLGVITFVAANWQLWGKVQKFVGLLLLLTVINTLGFHYWQRVANYKRLGQGLLLLGGLILGAVLALIAQMFNIAGSLYPLYFGWGIGVLAMAISLRFQPLGVLSLILMGLGYASFEVEQYTRSADNWLFWLGEGMPIVAVGLLPVSYWLRSRVVMALVGVLWLISIFAYFLDYHAGLAITIPFLLLWSYEDGLSLDRLGKGLGQITMQPIARVIAMIFLAMYLYFYSFYALWKLSYAKLDQFSYLDYGFLGLFGVLAVYGFVRIVLALPGRQDRLGQILMGMVMVFGVLLITASPIVGVTITNIWLFLVSIGLIRSAVEKGSRQNFWFGLLLLALQILGRLFEFETELLLKALAFSGCGVAVLLLGSWFERYLKQMLPPESHD